MQGVLTITKSDSAGPQGFGQPWPDGPDVSKPQRFTNTAVPRFDGTGCWQQHLLVFQAIMKSNRWPPDTAALQLFAHLDGDILQVALLLPDKIRDRWKDLVDKLSAYYKTPGRLAVFRRQFENAHRRPGSDPATFAIVRGLILQKHHDCSHRSTSTNFGPGLDITIIYQFLEGAKMGSLCGSYFGQIQDGRHPE